MLKDNIILIRDIDWSEKAASIINDSVNSILATQGRCSVMLTGGRSAGLLYVAWSNMSSFQLLRNVHFFFGDERCVTYEDERSNYGLVMRTLFRRGLPKECFLYPMPVDMVDMNSAALVYEKKLPDIFDLILVSAGDDGHVASIFPLGDALQNRSRSVVKAWSPNPPHSRLTITPLVLQSRAKKIFVLAIGAEKFRVLQNARIKPQDFINYPIRLVLDDTWLINVAF